jgi:hypothetical protein
VPRDPACRFRRAPATFGPYRSAARLETPEPRPERNPRSYDDQVVKLVFIVVGGLGVVVGIANPKCSVELSLGLVLLFFVVKWWLAERRP